MYEDRSRSKPKIFCSSFVRSFVRSFVHSFVRSFFRSSSNGERAATHTHVSTSAAVSCSNNSVRGGWTDGRSPCWVSLSVSVSVSLLCDGGCVALFVRCSTRGEGDLSNRNTRTPGNDKSCDGMGKEESVWAMWQSATPSTHTHIHTHPSSQSTHHGRTNFC